MTGHSIAIGQRETMGNPCMNNYTAGDGRRFWIVGLQGDRHWPALCRAVERPEWLSDERFATGRSRAANATELIGDLDAIFVTKPLDEWAKVFATEPDFFWSPINSIEDVVADEQFHAAGGVVYVPDGDAGVTRWWRRLPISTARRGSRARPRRDSANTPRRFSPNSETRPLQIKAILSRCAGDGGVGGGRPPGRRFDRWHLLRRPLPHRLPVDAHPPARVSRPQRPGRRSLVSRGARCRAQSRAVFQRTAASVPITCRRYRR